MIERRLKTREVAERLSCSQGQVAALIRAGRLKAINIGVANRPRYVIDPAALREFEEQATDNTAPKLIKPRRKKEPPLRYMA